MRGLIRRFPAIKSIKNIKKISDIPIIAEGKVNDAKDAINAIMAGAYAVVIGTSITRPEIITSRIVENIKRYGNES